MNESTEKSIEKLRKQLEKNQIAYTIVYSADGGFECKLDFSEHDKPFEDKIAKLENQIAYMKEKKNYLRTRCMEDATEAFDCGAYGRLTIVGRRVDLETENEKLKQRIAESESRETEKPTKINLNDQIKVKLTPLGVKIYYHQYDELNKQIKERGGKQLEPRMPEIDKDGYTKFTLWNFMELYGEHIGMCKPNMIAPLYIELCQDEWKMRYNEEPIEKGKE